MTDPLERLRAANPISNITPAPQGPAESRALRAQPRPGRARRMPLLLAAALAGACAFALVGLGGGTHRPEVGPQALATAAAQAMDPGRSILHIVMRTTQVGPHVAEEVSRSEIWLAPDGNAGRIRTTTEAGDVISDSSIKMTTDRATEFDMLSAARKMLREGSLTPAGTEQVEGRELRRFDADSRGLHWYFDPDTLVPVRFVAEIDAPDGAFTATTDFLLYKRLEDDEANRALLSPPHEVFPRPVRPTPRP
jgi:hypothetical protein